jgi:glycosyltransferase involved in cell wall biosynthesis
MRICFVSHSAQDGGAQRSLVDLIDALAARGVESRVVVPEEGYLTEELQPRAVPYVVFRYWPWARETPLPWWDRWFKKPLIHVMRAARLSGRIRRWRCHVIVSNTLTVCEGALAARILGLPHIAYVREFGDLDHGLYFELGARLSVRLLGLLSTRVAFNSAALAKHYRREVPPSRSRVIYNAVSVPTEPPTAREESPTPEATLSCVLVGYLKPGKGHQDAIRAVAHLAARGTRVSLKLVGAAGPADYLARLRRLIDSLGVSPLIEMVGHVPDPRRLFLEADVALMCSGMEAFGRVTVEAMKHGTPVIAARSGGTSEIIHDGLTGFLYTPGDARGLADRIEQLAQDRAGARRMGERARRFALERFNLERYGRDFLELVDEVMEARPSRAGRRLRGWRSATPAFWGAAQAIRARLRSLTGRRHAQVLIVDDDPLITQWLADSLSVEGHDVDVAGNVSAALTRMERSSYDLIISDLRMPELDGVAFYRMLERDRPKAARRVLFLTGNTDVAEYRAFVAEKRDCTVTKPVDLTELNRAARRILAIHGD